MWWHLARFRNRQCGAFRLALCGLSGHGFGFSLFRRKRREEDCLPPPFGKHADKGFRCRTPCNVSESAPFAFLHSGRKRKIDFLRQEEYRLCPGPAGESSDRRKGGYSPLFHSDTLWHRQGFLQNARERDDTEYPRVYLTGGYPDLRKQS